MSCYGQNELSSIFLVSFTKQRDVQDFYKFKQNKLDGTTKQSQQRKITKSG